MLNFSIQIIPIGVAQTIQNLIPFFVLILSYSFLKEKLPCLEVSNMIVSFGGVMLIIVISSYSKQSLSIGDISQGETTFFIGALFNVASAFSFALCNVVMRYLRSVHHSLVSSFQATSNFVFSLTGLLIYRLFINPNGFEYNFSAAEILLLLLTGFARTAS